MEFVRDNFNLSLLPTERPKLPSKLFLLPFTLLLLHWNEKDSLDVTDTVSFSYFIIYQQNQKRTNEYDSVTINTDVESSITDLTP